MLQFYYNPVSVNARRVWVALLEKEVPFEPILVKLDGDQFEAEFLAINPFQRVPVIIDAGFRVLESLAILDYLEAQYPSPALMPQESQAIALVRMVEMLAVNELQPATLPLTGALVGLEVATPKLEQAHQRITMVLQFYEDLLIEERPYLVGSRLTLADIVAGTLVTALPMLGWTLDAYPRLQACSDRLSQRESWQATTPQPQVIAAAIPNMTKILAQRLA